MRRNQLALPFLSLVLVSCGGGGNSGNNAPPPVTLPAPAPTPAPTPTPTPTPTPAQVTVTFPHIFGIDPLDGAQPNGPLLQASDGNFYGTTRSGGSNICRRPNDIPCGVIFKMTPDGSESVLYSFGSSASDGFTATAPLIQGQDGALYGMTTNGGDFDGGTVFKITLDGNYTILHSFGATPDDGVVPTGGLVQAMDGDFYGTTVSGGSNQCVQIPQSGGNCGTIFKITPDGTKTNLYSFGATLSDGVQPNGSLIQASDGNFYGTTANGGANTCGSANSCGTVFRMSPTGSVSILHSFGASMTDGIAPQGQLIEGSDGALYGTTPSGGGGTCGFQFGCGTVFRITFGGTVSILHAFALNGRSEGDGPSPFIIQASDGNFYGTTQSGGANASASNGTAFKLTPSGTHSVLFSFGPVNENPSDPLAGFIQANDGAFYGVTASNGTIGAVGARGGAGAIFKLSLQ